MISLTRMSVQEEGYRDRAGVRTPPVRVRRVPNQPKTPKRSVRVPTDLWEAAKRKAKDRGETLTDVIVRALRRYISD